MASSTGLINRALALLGAKRIISLDDTTAVGQLVRDTYDEIRQSLLQAHTWPFSTFLYQLGRETTPPLYGRAFAYRKPQATDQHGELLRTIGIFTDVDMKYWALRFIDLGPIVYSDNQQLFMHGVYDIVDPNRMSPLFRETLSFKLASEWAIPLTSSRSNKVDLAGQYEACLLRARALADMEGAPVEPAPSTWEMARFGGSDPFVRSEDPTTPTTGD